MNSGRPRLNIGPPVDAPVGFAPDKQWVSGAFMYRLDSKLQICQRRAIHWDGQGQSGFFRVSIPNSQSVPRKITVKIESPIVVPRGTLISPPAPKRMPSSRLAVRSLATIAIAAAALIVYPYFPAAQYAVRQSLPHPAQTQAAAATPISAVNRLTIPKIGVTAYILESPDLSILDRQEGVWHQTGSLVGGNMVLAGHRWKYLPPNSTTFYNLDKLQPGDTVIVDWGRQRYVYVVKSVNVIPATKTDILLPSKLPQLTLYTCDDKRQTRRISVVAEALP